jgi:IS5 family transposase
VYRKAELAPSPPSDFELPFGGNLSPDNRWVKMAQIIPWSEFESEYAANFPADKGAPAKSFRMALGALIIQEKLGISDRETVEQIRENPYLQYFIGQSSYSNELPYIKRNLAHIEQLIELGASLEGLTKKQYKTLLVLTEVTRQQQWLFDNNKQSIEDRIVSLSQPHIRPIVREKRRVWSQTISQLF